MCDRCTALEIAVSEQRKIIDCQSAEIGRLCEIIGTLQARNAKHNHMEHLLTDYLEWLKTTEAA